ncbi:hypothetical protein [Brucella sp. 2280]|uniref:hypothetical protein n=1 Tax=Brucella sp. 2280 TaxID=2592625 RepID=UPI0012961518|nr:hypothetical protein [Brucella sp. 2280]QGA56325.1 hypothetical protein GHC20_04160 [Brucella sp. 2280]
MQSEKDCALATVNLDAIWIGNPDEHGLRPCQVIVADIASQFMENPAYLAWVLTEMNLDLNRMPADQREAWLRKFTTEFSPHTMNLISHLHEAGKAGAA